MIASPYMIQLPPPCENAIDALSREQRGGKIANPGTEPVEWTTHEQQIPGRSPGGITRTWRHTFNQVRDERSAPFDCGLLRLFNISAKSPPPLGAEGQSVNVVLQTVLLPAD